MRTVRADKSDVDSQFLEGAVVLFDDDCSICSAAARILSVRTATMAWRGSHEGSGLPDCVPAGLVEESIVVVDGSGVYSHIEALELIVRDCGRSGVACAEVINMIRSLPGGETFAHEVYMSFSRNRNRIAHMLVRAGLLTKTCTVPIGKFDHG